MDTYPPPIKRGAAGNAASTPVSDGQSVYAVFGTGIVAAYDMNGERQWIRFIEGSRLGFGHASSPVLLDGRLIVHFQDLVALDASSGEELWRLELPARHATPIATRIEDVDVVVTPAGAIVRASDGKALTERAFSVSECSPIVEGRVIYAYESGRMKALELPETIGETVELETLWEGSSSRGRRTPSAVFQEGLLYAVNTSGILDITDAKTGVSMDRRRLDIGNVFSSATAAGNMIYLSGRKGTTVVIEAGQPYREVARNQLEGFGSSPVFIGERMYVRTRQHLYCIGQ
jgi:outer membrane protein assembly factor BamB